MFNRILVALDHSDYSNVFTQALSLARNTDATLMLLHVLSQQEKGSPVRIVAPYFDPIINDAAEEIYQSQWQRFEQEGLERLHRLCDQAAAKGVRTEITQLYGDPSRQICALARTWEADLIVIGRRGLSGFKEFFLGSVSNYVVHHAPCCVLIIHPSTLLKNRRQQETLSLRSAE